jgi:hypothetical protein
LKACGTVCTNELSNPFYEEKDNIYVLSKCIFDSFYFSWNWFSIGKCWWCSNYTNHHLKIWRIRNLFINIDVINYNKLSAKKFKLMFSFQNLLIYWVVFYKYKCRVFVRFHEVNFFRDWLNFNQIVNSVFDKNWG